MKSEIRPTEPSVFAVVSDEEFSLGELSPGNLASLEKIAETGQLFLMHADDASVYRLDVYVDESPPDELDIYFTATSGSYLLRAPTGRLVVQLPANRDNSQSLSAFKCGIEVPAGDYVVSVRDRGEVNLSAHRARVEKTVGSGDLRFYERLNCFGAVGCLTIGLGAFLALVRSVRRDYWPLLLVFALPTLLYHLMTRLPRYRRVNDVEEEPGKFLPTYLLVLKRVASAEGLSGGCYRD